MSFLHGLKTLFYSGKLDVPLRFVLLREAIFGTMSSFYMARELRSGKIVGLKILDPEKTAAYDARFKGLRKPAEGEISISLHHPRIVETFEHGVTTEGAQYIVMEFIEGPGMNWMILTRSETLNGRRVTFIRQTAEALAAVHAAGYIHRDVCPRNLILSGDCESVKLTDFGLSVPAKPKFMLPGNRTGTPNYMAPELVRRRPTDQRLDIFSFGVTAYEMCAFTLPWPSGATGMAAMTHSRPPTDIRTHRPQMHPTLAKAIHWCIEPELPRRCPSMERFLRMIRDVEHEDVQKP